MTSDAAFVWVWLPGQTEPVVCGRLENRGNVFVFNYGASYLSRPEAVPLFEEELPLREGAHIPVSLSGLAGCLRDAAPDAWGRRVIENRLLIGSGSEAGSGELDEMTYLMESGSDRFGAIDFQGSSTNYEARVSGQASMQELMEAAERVEQGIPLSPALEAALIHGTSLGGARPKALLGRGDGRFIAKFSSSTDTFNVVKAEYVGMRLAKACGLHAADVSLEHIMGKDVLLVQRFDRVRIPSDASCGWARRMVVSALTLLGLSEMEGRYASYQDIAERIRHSFEQPKAQLGELHDRLILNVLLGNTDDHARNHALFCEPGRRVLTPAYDICPQRRTGAAASQAMFIRDQQKDSRLETVFSAAPSFLRSREDAISRTADMLETIRAAWSGIALDAQLQPVDRAALWKGPLLHPFAFEHLGPDAVHLEALALSVRSAVG